MQTTRIKTIKEKIYYTLKEEICNGTFAPGTQIQEQDLAARFSSSRSPVREALKQLVSDGLLVEYPNRGVFVRRYTAKDIEDIFDMRILLEGYALREAEANLTPGNIVILNDLLQELKENHEMGNLVKYIDKDANLHHKIVALCKNDLVISTYERISDMTQQFRIYSLKSHKRYEESIGEHTQIISYLLEGNPAEAYRVNKEHLSRAKEAIIEYLKSQE